MRRRRSVCWLAGVLALAPVIGNAAIDDKWEGEWQGAKAVTLTLREADGRVDGNAVFYVIWKEGAGEQSRPASPEIPLQDARWDGVTLRFSFKGGNGQPVVMEMRVTGADTAELTREAGGGMPGLTVPLHKQ